MQNILDELKQYDLIPLGHINMYEATNEQIEKYYISYLDNTLRYANGSILKYFNKTYVQRQIQTQLDSKWNYFEIDKQYFMPKIILDVYKNYCISLNSNTLDAQKNFQIKFYNKLIIYQKSFYGVEINIFDVKKSIEEKFINVNTNINTNTNVRKHNKFILNDNFDNLSNFLDGVCSTYIETQGIFFDVYFYYWI